MNLCPSVYHSHHLSDENLAHLENSYVVSHLLFTRMKIDYHSEEAHQ